MEVKKKSSNMTDQDLAVKAYVFNKSWWLWDVSAKGAGTQSSGKFSVVALFLEFPWWSGGWKICLPMKGATEPMCYN